MRSKFLAIAGACLCAFLLAGCGSIPHNNVMLFGTDTNFGIAAGTSATNIPQVNIGYQRREAVVMPLLANVTGSNGAVTPCTITNAADAQACKFVAEYGGQSRDSYSVIASFGARFEAQSSTNTPNASGGLAQYFATGVAAQILALKGGASVIAIGQAAEASAKNNVSTELGILVNSPEVVSAARTVVAERTRKRTEIADALIAKTDDAALTAEAQRLGRAIGSVNFFQNRCGASAALRACIDGPFRAGTVVTDDLHR
ncbi:MAG: hypothetical protein WDM79_08325 [Terricaulis sp.]